MSDKKKRDKSRFAGPPFKSLPRSEPNFYHQRKSEIQEVLSRYEEIDQTSQVSKSIFDRPASEWIKTIDVIYDVNVAQLKLDNLNLNKLILIRCTVEEMSIKNSEIEEFIVISSNIKFADFTNANLDNSVMVNVEANNCLFISTSIKFAWLEGNFTDSNFSRSKLVRTIIKGNFANVLFTGANLQDSWMREVNIYSTDFTDANLRGSTGDLTAMNNEITLPDSSIYVPITNDFYKFTKKSQNQNNRQGLDIDHESP